MANNGIDYNRNTANADAYTLDVTSPLISARNFPTTAPTEQVLASTMKVAINGKKTVTKQTARIEYLSDGNKLLLPAGLFRNATPGDTGNEGLAMKVINSIRHVAGVLTIGGPQRFTTITAKSATNQWAGPLVNWDNVMADADGNTLSEVGITVVHESGYFNHANDWRVRHSDDVAGYEVLTITWGDSDADVMQLSRFLDVDVPASADTAECIDNPQIKEQLQCAVSGAVGLNFSIGDSGKLIREDMRWTARKNETDVDEHFPAANLSPYTLSMCAALNLDAVGGISRLAWTRSYGTSFGLLPADDDVHGREYQITDVLPENAELSTVMEAHPTGAEGQVYVRGCLSIIAAFGALHLSNDHTYKPSDDGLIRKGESMVRACRTTLNEGEAELLLSGNNLERTVRTTCHPFSLSSTLTAFKLGQERNLLAEPLMIRDAVVPPPVAKVGLIVSEMTKIFALPIGGLFRQQYNDAYTTYKALKSTVVDNARAYSALHKHYGMDVQQKLTTADEDGLDSLVPIVAGYCEVFEVDENDNPTGASLSYTIRNARDKHGALVELYAAAFGKYSEEAVDLETLLSGSSAKSSSA